MFYPDASKAADIGKPVRNGTNTVEPNIANKCCKLSSAHCVALGLSCTSNTGLTCVQTFVHFPPFSSSHKKSLLHLNVKRLKIVTNIQISTYTYRYPYLRDKAFNYSEMIIVLTILSS